MPVKGTYGNPVDPNTPPPVKTDPGSDSGLPWGEIAAGAAGVGAAALGMRSPAIRTALGKLLDMFSTIETIPMLSGGAVPKSALGNLGAVVNTAGETKSLEPLKKFFSLQTVKDYGKELLDPGSTTLNPNVYAGASRYNPFGRMMGAGDTATRSALVRAGSTPQEAERVALQAPLPHAVADALDSPIARYAMRFRRLPINQALEGARTLKMEHPAMLAAHTAAGAATGYATADEQNPLIPAFYGSFANTYGAPAMVGAAIGRSLAGGSKTGAQNMIANTLPVSEYGITQSVLDPLAPFDPKNFALTRFIRQLRGQ